MRLRWTEIYRRNAGVITREQMFDPILEVCPSFQGTWDEYVTEWRDEPDGLPHYLALTDLARHLIAMLQRNETEQLHDVFRVVEDWHLTGDSYVKEAASVGLLEDLQNTNLHGQSTTPDDFLQFLLPETQYWWAKVVDFWGKGEIIVDDRKRH